MNNVAEQGQANVICQSRAMIDDLSAHGIFPLYCHWVRHASGKRIGEGWASPVSGSALSSILADAQLDQESSQIDFCFGFSERKLSLSDGARLPGNISIGVKGLALHCGARTLRASPLDMLLKQESFSEAAAILVARMHDQMDPADVRADEVIPELAVFSCRMYAMRLRAGVIQTPVVLYRGKPLVSLREVTQERVHKLACDLVNWMAIHVSEEGKLTYSYDPYENEDKAGGNRIREWMGTLALFEAATHFENPVFSELAEATARYQLRAHYREEADYGVIVEGKKVKLGAASLAALALRAGDRSQHAMPLEKIFLFTCAMWQEDGSFRTFLRPEGRDADCQNFYPGETLLLWADIWLETRDAALWNRIYRSFEYYRDWHRRNPNPAFVPWHTQAYMKLWRVTQDEGMRDFILEMNDWLLPFQQWEKISDYPDAQGRFYDPDKPYGPPHASSTGVYLEGLTDAFCLAQAIGDQARMHAYAGVIRRGLRNVLQLQINHDVEIARLPSPQRAFGGVRTTEYDALIRIDNVQHNLMAVLKLLGTTDFPWAD